MTFLNCFTPRGTAVSSDLAVYLLDSGGSDVLDFWTPEAARAAADALRLRAPDVHVEARYSRVHLWIKTGPQDETP